MPSSPLPADTLDLGSAKSGGLGRWWLRGAVVLLLAGVAGWLLFSPPTASTAARYQTAPVERGDLTVTVAATGTLQPTHQVDVGSELSGIVQLVLVEENSLVKKDQILARLDLSKLENEVASASAAVEVAEAKVLEAEATQAEAEYNLARQKEIFALSQGKTPSRTEMKIAEATYARASAAVIGAKATVKQSRATLRTHETNLSKASIRSPIDGVVLTRQVEPGQTVASSLQAPVLFTLAEDLAHMELQVKVDEADVGQVRSGQSAIFTVDAYPARDYPAVITRVSFGATTSENVVTYRTLLEVNNDDLSLRPGMTASAEITTTELHDALLIPNAALRFTPPRDATASKQSLISSLIPRRPRKEKQVRVTAERSEERTVWVLKDGQPTALEIRTGATNGRVTEVLSGDLKPGMEVITEAVDLPQ